MLLSQKTTMKNRTFILVHNNVMESHNDYRN
jgi:hypothetical protein